MNSEQIRFIDCHCGEWEQMNSDEPKWHTQSFTYIRDLPNNEAEYRCSCGEVVQSEIGDKDE